MKKHACAASILIAGCASQYVPPSSGPSATLVLPAKEEVIQFFGGRREHIWFGVADSSGCGYYNKEIEHRDGDDSGTIPIPANTYVFVRYHVWLAGYQCDVDAAFYVTPENTYQPIKRADISECVIEVSETTPAGRKLKIPLKSLGQNLLTGKVCLKDK